MTVTTAALAGQIGALADAVGARLAALAVAPTGSATAGLAEISAQITALEQGIASSIGSLSSGNQAIGDALAKLQASIAAAVAADAPSYGPITADSLADLPEPRLVEPLDFETILARMKATFAERSTAAGLPGMADYMVLESAPETILLEDAAYSELAIRNRINQVYVSRLLYKGIGADLDYTADEYGVTRLTDAGEKDDALKSRVRIKNRGSSAAGPDDWWRYWARTADARVQDVAVTRSDFPIPAPGQQRGQITIWVLANTTDGVATDDILANVRLVLNDRAVRGVTTEVIVRAASTRAFDVTSDVWLLPDAQPAAFAGIETLFRAAYGSARALGFDVTRSWVSAKLMQPGVQRVELAGWSDVAVAPNEAPRLGTVTLRLAGRAY